MQNWLILAKFPPKNPAKSAVFVFVSPRNFPWNRRIFLRICLWKSFEIWHFSAKIPRNRPIFLWILTFFLQKYQKLVGFSANLPLKIRRNFAFFSAKYQKPWLCTGWRNLSNYTRMSTVYFLRMPQLWNVIFCIWIRRPWSVGPVDGFVESESYV